MSAGPMEMMGRLLEDFLRADDTEAGEQRLADLMSNADTIIERELRRKLISWTGRAPEADLEDMASQVRVDLLARFRQLKAPGGASPIANVPAYIASAAHHAAHAHLRSRFPQRHRLKTKLRYLLSTESRFAIWEADRDWLCGLSDWRGRAAAKPEQMERWNDARRHSDPDAQVAAILERVGAPLPLDDLAGMLAEVWGVSGRVASLDDIAPIATGAHQDPAALFERRVWLERLWTEIRELPVNQRAALLLYIRLEDGSSAMFLFPVMGVASMRQIAAALEMPADALAAIWNALPLDDLATAAHLGVSRQQVINYRKSARERLIRRMRDFFEGGR
jgi:hypothetical protein